MFSTEFRYKLNNLRRILKKDHRENGKNDKGNHFLDHFQLNKCKRSAIALKTDTVAWDLERILEKSHSPRYQDNTDERPVVDHFHLLQL